MILSKGREGKKTNVDRHGEMKDSGGNLKTQKAKEVGRIRGDGICWRNLRGGNLRWEQMGAEFVG
jgi:hypothetical protein